MNNENKVSLTLLDACTLLARETVSLLEGSDLLPGRAVNLLDALFVICGNQNLDDGGALLAWASMTMENTKRYVKKGDRAEPVVKLKTPLSMPAPDMQMDAVCLLLKAVAERRPTLKQWQTMLDAVRIFMEMDDLEEMILDGKIPYGGFLKVQELRTLLDSVQAAVEAKRKEARVSPCEAAASEKEGLPPEKT